MTFFLSDILNYPQFFKGPRVMTKTTEETPAPALDPGPATPGEWETAIADVEGAQALATQDAQDNATRVYAVQVTGFVLVAAPDEIVAADFVDEAIQGGGLTDWLEADVSDEITSAEDAEMFDAGSGSMVPMRADGGTIGQDMVQIFGTTSKLADALGAKFKNQGVGVDNKPTMFDIPEEDEDE